jgi:Ca2+-binding EF-hand superfamily protein
MASGMFDPEVLEVLRAQFDQADTDGSGQIDSAEAATFFARFCSPDDSQEQVRSS